MNFLPGMRLKNCMQTNLQRFLKASSVFDSDGAVDVIGIMQVRKFYPEALYNAALYRLILKAL